jgi:hypothetical protein
MKNYQAHESCTACGTLGVDRCYHHILTRKARPDLKDAIFNKIPLCLTHHNEIHAIGTQRFAQRWERVYEWLVKNGWTIDEYTGKWTHD